MIIRPLARASLAAASLLALAALAWPDTLHVKPGLWEVTSSAKATGMPAIDTSRMSRGRRAKVEAAIKAHLASQGGTTVTRECITTEALEKGPFQDDGVDASCKRTLIANTSTLQAFTIECRGTNGTMRFEAIGAERVNGRVAIRIGGGGAPAIEVSSTFVAKWIGPSCGNVGNQRR